RTRHPPEDAVDARLVDTTRDTGVPAAGGGGGRGELGGLGRVEGGRRLAEIVASRGPGPADPPADVHHVQVQLEDPPLGERALDLPGQDRLLHLADRVARGRQPEILHEVLGDGRRAPAKLSISNRVVDDLPDLAEVEAVVAEEVSVL